MTILKRDQERQDWNTASDLFARHHPHFPRMTDDDPLLPPESREYRKRVIAAIMDGIKAGRYGDGSTVPWSERS